MAIKEMLVTLRQLEIKPDKWKVIGTGGHAYKVLEHTRDIPADMKSGTITFKIQKDGDAANPITLVGHVADGGPDTVNKDGAPMKDADLHSEFRIDHRLRFPRLTLVTVLVIDFKFAEGDTDQKFSFFGDTPLKHDLGDLAHGGL